VIWQEGPEAFAPRIGEFVLLRPRRRPRRSKRNVAISARMRIGCGTQPIGTRAWPVGSGAVESAAKHLVQQRKKRAGMRWSELGARAILHLRCALLNFDLLKQAA